ncbi:MAG: bifunctional diaminohydroxyphosphoribosylaminopyrimidine deaminase/5-amino-6-(5-phosphoribosylamino)uracil reductase RibD [Deltaproteobacteria bacterium]|nr:bifunctional diaminohydroxyphosphoribosylaminopyrimidine deaminase/5-amino-6-(5-phosphoribosylamino)uracil reductase RibD [Deltaproteobacteria bacterium]
MRRAVALAERALGRTSPNPAVGAVVVKAGRVVGEGWTRPVGGPHAEVVALRRAGARARGATLYVTLEPCAHFGRTPPCADAVVAAGVARVVAAVGDPNPRVRGRGFRRLARAGVAVTTGVLAEEAAGVSAWFRHFVVRRRPFVILKLAASLDGRIATAAGESRWITGAAARRWVHELRNRVDAVMVGSGTVRADDPSLRCRLRGGRDPLRIVIDGRLRMPIDATVVRQRSAAATIVATTAAAPTRRRRSFAAAGVEVIVMPAIDGKVDLAALLRVLATRGIVSVLVEGGGDLAAAMVHARLVDRLAVVTAPVLLGSDARPMLGALGLRRLGDGPRLDRPVVVPLGSDVLRDGRVAY